MTQCTAAQMLEEHRRIREQREFPDFAKKLQFKGAEGYDVYNPTAPFNYKWKKLICARAEKRDSERSEAVFFEECGQDLYQVSEGKDRYQLQAPCMMKVRKEWILGGTEVFPSDERPGKNRRAGAYSMF